MVWLEMFNAMKSAWSCNSLALEHYANFNVSKDVSSPCWNIHFFSQFIIEICQGCDNPEMLLMPRPSCCACVFSFTIANYKIHGFVFCLSFYFFQLCVYHVWFVPRVNHCLFIILKETTPFVFIRSFRSRSPHDLCDIAYENRNCKSTKTLCFGN